MEDMLGDICPVQFGHEVQAYLGKDNQSIVPSTRCNHLGRRIGEYLSCREIDVYLLQNWLKKHGCFMFIIPSHESVEAL